MGEIILGDNLDVLRTLPDRAFQLIYVDPPFNTGKSQSRTRIRVTPDPDGDRTGFQGRRYRTQVIGSSQYADVFDDYIGFLRPRMEEAYRVLDDRGSLFLHVDYREVHYCKVMLDEIFGRESFINEIIWAYDYGGRPKTRWPAKHDNILWYAKDPNNYTFNYDAMDRIPYMAPGLVGPEKAARGKTPTDVWWQTIVNGREKTGYSTQKPLAIVSRIVRVHSNPGDRLLDFFAGSGTLGEAAHREGREFTLIDNNPEAVAVMRKRLAHYGIVVHGPDDSSQVSELERSHRAVAATSSSDITTKPTTFAELRAALDNRGTICDPLSGQLMDADHVKYDGIKALCERRSELFALVLGLSDIEPLEYFENSRLVDEGVACGVISNSTAVDLMAGSARFRGRRASDGIPVYVRVEADFTIRKAHVKRVRSQAGALETLLRHFGPPEKTGIAVPVLAGHQLYTDRYGLAEPLWDTIFVQI